MKRLRFIPAAITPIFYNDVVTTIFSNNAGTEKFEKKLATYFSQSNAYTFGSLMRTVYACFIGLSANSKRRKVILPRYSCPSFIHGVLAAGLIVEYCDVDPFTLSIDMDSLEKLEMEDVLAVVCTNLFGLTSKIDKICSFCESSDVYVVEGVDYGIGTEYKERRIGTWGDVAILNFQEGKAIPIGGGAIVSSLPSLRKMYGYSRKHLFPNYFTMCGFTVFSRPIMYGLFMRVSSFLGIEKKNFSMEDTIRKTSTETDFRFDPSNFDFAISNFQGELGCRIIDRLELDASHRFENASILAQLLENIPDIHVINAHDAVNKIHFIRFPILVGNGKRDAVLAKLLESGIEASPMYVEHGMDIDVAIFPGAAKVASELLTIPCHPYTSVEDIYLIGEILKRAGGSTCI